jgi:hypothetical protein
LTASSRSSCSSCTVVARFCMRVHRAGHEKGRRVDSSGCATSIVQANTRAMRRFFTSSAAKLDAAGPVKMRSQAWFGPKNKDGFLHRRSGGGAGPSAVHHGVVT